MQTVAAKALAKIAPIFMQLQADTSDPMFSQVPKVLRTNAQSHLKDLEMRYKEATSVMSNTGPPNLSFTLQDAATRASQATSAYTELMSELNISKRHSKA